MFKGYTDTSRRLADDVDNDTRYDVVGGGSQVDGLETEVAGPETIGEKKLRWMGGIHVSLSCSTSSLVMILDLGSVFVLYKQ